MDGKYILTYIDIKACLSYKAITESFEEAIEERKKRVLLLIRSSSIDFSKGENEKRAVKYLSSLPEERFKIITMALDKMNYFKRVDSYLNKKKIEVEQVVWKTTPFKMLYIGSKDLDVYFTADSIIEVENGEQRTILLNKR